MTICLNACLAIDLILMIRNPFLSKEKRMSVFLWSSITLSITIGSATTITSDYEKLQERFVPDWWVMGSIYVFILAYFIISIFSIVYAFKRLRKPGISKEVQSLVLKRHIISIIGFILSQLYCFVSLVFLVMPIADIPT